MKGVSGPRLRGMTLIELLIAGLILVVLLTIAGAFFARQTQLQRNVQTRNELQDGSASPCSSCRRIWRW